ncbi:uncharacterized protein LOC106518089 [Austrofundulus limnaeus]|uniref:Uncharacterized protein LOC106518089 n=1 Tax=Austrofundulus limnaeus TaxID=52670 RepID=A0A2I4BA55_AUSLI|nr:PREDICTED: uncharacterized protein LOC106518089 [Austrofundulus limnaeus]
MGGLAVFVLLSSFSVIQTLELLEQIHLTEVELGSNVTLTCEVYGHEKGLFYWFKLNYGYMVQTVAKGSFNHVNLEKQFENSRFSVVNMADVHSLTIKNVSKEDEATYFCQTGTAYTMAFVNGTHLAVRGPQNNLEYVNQSSDTKSVSLGTAVTLNCSLFPVKKENSHQCEHRAFWFRAGSNPGLIYTDKTKCDPQTRRSCIYQLSKMIQKSSDAGTYYCAVVTCGQILFGEGTKVEIRQEVSLLVIILGVLLGCSVLINLTLILTRRKQKGASDYSKGDGTAFTCIKLDEFTVDQPGNMQDGEEDGMNYVALNFSQKSTRWKNRRETPGECTYSTIKQSVKKHTATRDAERTLNYSVVQRLTESDPADPGTLQCSVLSDSENQTCSEDPSVFWFKASSQNSHPDIMYTDGIRPEECDKTFDPQRRCRFKFSKKIHSSDSGTYYCAVATCGQIFIGSGTNLKGAFDGLDHHTSLWYLSIKRLDEASVKMTLVWVTLFLLHQGHSLVPVVTVQPGQTVTFTCTFTETYQAVTWLHWYKQSGGENLKLITMLRKNTNPSYGPEIIASRYETTYESTICKLTILKTIKEDEGMYHCAHMDWIDATWTGTYLSVQGNSERTSWYNVVQQTPGSGPAHPAYSGELQCSVLSDSNNEMCSGDHGVFWFRARSNTSYPDMIHTDGNRAAHCDKKRDTERRCRYQFSKTISSSDAGTYLCAVATCGQILFGSGTNLEMGDLGAIWFRARSDKSYPDMIYTDGKRAAHCDKKRGTERGCRYQFSKNISSSDAGTYLCAVATCGQILFGSRTNLKMDETPSSEINLLMVIIICLAISVTVNIVFICFRMKKSASKQLKETRNNDMNQLDHDNSGVGQDLNYAALHFSGGEAPRGKKKRELTEESVYSQVFSSTQNVAYLCSATSTPTGHITPSLGKKG